ncbi:MAG: hypothetical protein ACP5UB_11420 [Candidatus Sumerlaeaceae bacterium]
MVLRVPRYWARCEREVVGAGGTVYQLVKYGVSDKSHEEAQREAERLLDALVARVLGRESLDHYAYSTRMPLREELIQELRRDGNLLGFVTRNSYGALVLNTAQVMFVDIDCPQPKPRGGLLRRLFGKSEPAGDPAAEALDRVAAWSRSHSTYSFRAYRTHAGLRLLFTSHVFEAGGSATRSMLEDLGADPLYVRLCQAQECFRARLTPKPWRVGMRSQRHAWPQATPAQEAARAKWLRTYDDRRAKFAVCALVGEFGRGEMLEEAATIVRLHDEMTCTPAGAPLA